MGSSWTEGPQGGLVPPLVMPEHYPYKKVSISLNVREGGVTLGIEILPTYRFLQVRRREAGPDGRRGKDYLLVDDAGKEWPAIVALETSARTSHYVYETHADFPHPEHRSGNFARAREYLRGVSPSRFRRSPTLTDPLTSSAPDSYPSPASLSQVMVSSGCSWEQLPEMVRRGASPPTSPMRSTSSTGYSSSSTPRETWVECNGCKRLTSVASGKCTFCATAVTAQGFTKFVTEVQCVLCKIWRKVSQQKADSFEGWQTDCKTMGFRKTSCMKAPKLVSQRRRIEPQSPVPAAGAVLQAKSMVTLCVPAQPSFRARELGGRHVSYVPGRDTVISKPVDLHVKQKDGTLRHVCVFAPIAQIGRFQDELTSYLGVFLSLHDQDSLPKNCDGRCSAGPLDLRMLEVNELAAGAQMHADPNINKAMQFGKYVNVHPDGRKYFMGDLSSEDNLRHAKFMKAWKSLPIPSWSGGHRLADTTYIDGNKSVVKNQLSKIPEIGDVEHHLSAAARVLWDQFEGHLPEVASEMLAYKREHGAGENVELFAGTGWNAYSVNVNYRTAAHRDGKNVSGSYSALVIQEVGPAFCGGFYMIPELHIGFDCRSGSVLYHRSDADLHGNAAAHFEPGGKRVAIVLYLTKMKTGACAGVDAADGEAGGAAKDVARQLEEEILAAQGKGEQGEEGGEDGGDRAITIATTTTTTGGDDTEGGERDFQEPMDALMEPAAEPLMEPAAEPLSVQPSAPAPAQEVLEEVAAGEDPAVADAGEASSKQLKASKKRRREKEYVVEKVVSHRYRNRGKEYLIKWQGYPSSENTWEPASNCNNCARKIREYEESSAVTRVTRKKVKDDKAWITRVTRSSSRS